MNWRAGFLRLWLVASFMWIAPHCVRLVKDGGLDFSERTLRFDVAGRPFTFPAEDNNAKIIAAVSADGAAEAGRSNESRAKRCPTFDLEAFSEQASKGPFTLDCLPAVAPTEPMITGPLYEARAAALPPLRLIWFKWLEWGVLPPIGALIAGWLAMWVAAGFRT